jgi:hypothetical protein
MNYIKQVNSFYELLLTNPINANSQCLYFALLNINNRCNWKKDFTVANITLMTFTGLNMSALQRARNNLIQKGYINYKKGTGNNAGMYTIVEFNSCVEQQSEQQNAQQSEQQNEQQSDSKPNSTTNTLDKQNKTKKKKKQKENENAPKKYGEYQNVFFNKKQFEKLIEYFPNDYEERIQKLDDYIQSTGREYKDCLATLRNWARKEGYVKPIKQEKKTYQVNTMSEEEYWEKARKEYLAKEKEGH